MPTAMELNAKAEGATFKPVRLIQGFIYYCRIQGHKHTHTHTQAHTHTCAHRHTNNTNTPLCLSNTYTHCENENVFYCQGKMIFFICFLSTFGYVVDFTKVY